ncbi:MAG: hypothetical protein LPK45_08680, partial [Bacteroidota bacterium]|nr:hypothetical protein [Bacteroidota bacterium]MDX5431151.1 hypothetical protein [Bacteroidota bacterium]MDX5469898.1 hypothetical protein [Bacteroidota bacterium]
IDREIFTLQEAGLEKSLEKALKVKALIKTKDFTQERNQFLIQYLNQLDSSRIINELTQVYEQCGEVALLLDDPIKQ